MGNTKINKSDLGYMGSKTQKQIVKIMIENPKWLSIYLDCIKKDKSLFSVKYLDVIIDFTKREFETKGVTPSYAAISAFLKADICKTDEEYDEAKALVLELKGDTLLQDIQVGETTGMDALKKAELLYTLDNSRAKIENMKGFDETLVSNIQENFGKIMRVSSSKIEDCFVSSLFPSICSDTPKERVRTGIKELDKQLNGGIPKGMLALLIAGTGVGKTTLGSIICCGSAVQGKKVMQIFFEDTKEDIARKHIAYLTNTPTNKIYGETATNLINELMTDENYKDTLNYRLRTVRMENGETTVETIRNYINTVMNNEGWKPDMIFIDYLSCLLPTENKTIAMQNEWQAWERCMKKLEVLAKDLNIVIWVSQQTNRNGMITTTAKERMANIQGSFRAIQPCSFVLYLDRTLTNDNDFNKASLYLDKCRGCQPCEWRDIYMNNGTCQIDLSFGIHPNEELEWKSEDNNNNTNFVGVLN